MGTVTGTKPVVDYFPITACLQVSDSILSSHLGYLEVSEAVDEHLIQYPEHSIIHEIQLISKPSPWRNVKDNPS